ncbi:hypothetical protein HYALB_00011608 [Hymenoscyphus albidus]|uniref:Uncharacterized protein n=1 Tax=Hymenoscyphus albidus TaxID=595503 RepID=A0A9N9LSG3_9HELO|nr:hypothetical protein HYALB_00011608 [Hymenoscyphus albidus]
MATRPKQQTSSGYLFLAESRPALLKTDKFLKPQDWLELTGEELDKFRTPDTTLSMDLPLAKTEFYTGQDIF